MADEVTTAAETPVTREREVYFDEAGFVETPVVDRGALAVGEELDGPAVVEEAGCTSLLLPGTTAVVSPNGNLRVEL
jgi:N-methylhydantoinase A